MTLLSIFFGSLVGISLGLTGGGGAIFAVPMLVYGLRLPAREAVVISLLSVGTTSAIGFVQKWKRRDAELRTGLLFAAAGMIGAPIGTWGSRQVPDSILMMLFSGLMITISVVMWRKGRRAEMPPVCLPEIPEQAESDHRDGPGCQRDVAGNLILTSRCARLLLVAGVASGALSGMFGVGGGFIIVPALVIFSSMSMSRAVGTSMLVISLVSTSGIVSQLSLGQEINWRVTALFAVGGIIGLLIGTSVSHRLSAAALQKTFSVAILVVAAFVLFKNFATG
ncbi:MAG: sulfite exporter TauE/SafE family protein [Planctomycetaceae bacterium]|nr:sulfite exporter TauE/SafE family protein [Planctomycetaceae bacterium]